MREKAKGFALAALAAALYGTNPAFALPLYKLGLTPLAVLFFRYLLGLPFVAFWLALRQEGICLAPGQYLPAALAGVTMAVSSLALYQSYLYMPAGIASTLLFMYPVLTALIMTLFFQEKLRLSTIASLLVMGAGLYLLAWQTDAPLNLAGFALVFVSSATYAVYLVYCRISKALAGIHPLKSLCWQLFFGGLFYAPFLPFQSISLPRQAWLWLACLVFLPTLLSLLCTLRAIRLVGPTATAIFGALEPVTAVILAVAFFGETLTLREIAGGLLIILATLLVVAASGSRKPSRSKSA